MKRAFWVTFAGTAAFTMLALVVHAPRTSAHRVIQSVPFDQEPLREASESRVEIVVEPATVVPVRRQPTDASTPPLPNPEPKHADRIGQEFLTSVLLPAGDSNGVKAYDAQQLIPRTPVAAAPRAASLIDTEKDLSAVFSRRRPHEADSVISALNQYARAWNSKDIDDINAIRPGLERRTVKQELASARSISMQIEPVGAPKIDGDRATVECIHRVDQIFEDGTQKQSPDVHMTYVLVKRNGNWLIADSR